MSCFYVRPVGFPESEHAWLEAILTIGRGMLRDEWRWITEGSADVYLVAVESPAQWQRYRAELPPGRLVACALPDLDLDARWRVKRDREHLPGLRELTRALNDLADELAAGSVAAAPVAGAGVDAAAPVAPEPAAAPAQPATATVVAEAADSLAAASTSLQATAPVMSHPATTAAESPAQAPVVADEAAPPQRVETPAEPYHPVPTASGAEAVYDPEEYLIGIVREALADGVPRRLTCTGGGGTVLIEPERRLYFVPGDKVFLWPILSAPRRQIEVQLLTHAELTRDTVGIHAHGLALGDLVFLAALAGSHGRLWIGCRADEPVRLRQWPDLKSLPQYVEYINLAAFMSGNTADVRAIAEHTGAGLEKVVNFHNACGALDLLERGGEVSIRQKPMNAGVRNLYQKIAKRLHGEA